MIFSKRLFRPLSLTLLLSIILTLAVFQNCGGNIESNKKLFSESIEPEVVVVNEVDDIEQEKEDFKLDPVVYIHTTGGPGIQSNAKVFIVSDVEGKGLRYQWYHSQSGTSEFIAMTGATAASLEISSASPMDEGLYRLEVISPMGDAFFSNSVQIKIENPSTPGTLDINITQQPASTMAFQGQNEILSVDVATESGQVGYNWQKRNPGQSIWTNVANGNDFSGQGTMNLTIHSVTPSDIAFFRVQVNNGLTGAERTTRMSQEVLLSVFSQPMPNQTTSGPKNSLRFNCHILTVKPNGRLSTPSDITWDVYDRRANQNKWISIMSGPDRHTGTTYSSTVNARYSAYRCSVTNFYGEVISRTSDIDHRSWYEAPTTEIDGAKYRWRMSEHSGNGEYEFLDSASHLMRSGAVYPNGDARWRWKQKFPSDTQFSFIQNSQMNNITTQTYVAYHSGTYDLGQPTEFQALIYDEFGMYHVAPDTALVKGGEVNEISETSLNIGLNESVRIEFESFIRKRNQSWADELPKSVTFLWQRWDGKAWIDLSESAKNQKGIIVSSGSSAGSRRYRLRVTLPNGSLPQIQKFHIFAINSQNRDLK